MNVQCTMYIVHVILANPCYFTINNHSVYNTDIIITE